MANNLGQQGRPIEQPHSSVLKRFAHLLSAQWLRDALHAVFLIVLARGSQATFGEFFLAFGLAQIVVFLGEFGLNQPLVGALSRRYSVKGDILAQYTLIKGLLLGGGLLAVFIFSLTQSYRTELIQIILVLSAGMATEALASTFFVACRVEGRQDLEGRSRAISALLGYGYAITMLLCGAPPILIAFFKLIENGANLFFAIMASHKAMDFRRVQLGPKSIARTWATAKDGLDFVFIALTSIIYNKANMFFLKTYAGPEGVAQYGVTWELIDGVSVAVTNLLLRNVLYPIFVKLWKYDRSACLELVKTSVRWLIGAALPIMFVLAVESDRIISFIYGPQYTEAVWMQKILVLTIGIAFLHNLAAYIMMSQKRQRLLLYIYIAGLILNLLLCSVLIPDSPLLGCALSIVFTKLAVAIGTVGYIQWQLHIISIKLLWPIFLASIIGAGAYFLLSPLGVREIAEGAAILPFIFLGWRWYKEHQEKSKSPLSPNQAEN